MGRRGTPKMIISNNAAQFKLVKNVVDKQWRELTFDEELLSYLSNNGIQRSFPLMDSEVDYCPTVDSVSSFLNTWKKGQIQLNTFWNLWRNDYLTSLRERAPYHKLSRGQIHAHPRVGQVVLIKEDNMPRGVWKIGRIDGLCNSCDGKVWAAEVCLPNGQHIKRAINHLYPLEVADENLKFKEVTSKMNYDSNDSFIQRAGHIKETNRKKLPMR